MDENSSPEKVVEAVVDHVGGKSLGGKALSAAGKSLGGKSRRTGLGITGSFLGGAVGVIAASAVVSTVRKKTED